MREHYIRTARKAFEDAGDEVRDLERQRTRNRQRQESTLLIESELKRARRDKLDARSRVRNAERVPA